MVSRRSQNIDFAIATLVTIACYDADESNENPQEIEAKENIRVVVFTKKTNVTLTQGRTNDTVIAENVTQDDRYCYLKLQDERQEKGFVVRTLNLLLVMPIEPLQLPQLEQRNCG